MKIRAPRQRPGKRKVLNEHPEVRFPSTRKRKISHSGSTGTAHTGETASPGKIDAEKLRENLQRYQLLFDTQKAITRVLAESASLLEAAPKLIHAVCKSAGWEVGAFWHVDEAAGELHCLEYSSYPPKRFPEFEAITRGRTFSRGIGLPGRVWSSSVPAWISDITRDSNFPRAPMAIRDGLHGAVAFPVRAGGEIVGILEFFSREIRQPDPEFLELVAGFGSQISQYVERKQAEETLRESEGRYRTLFDSTPMAVFVCDRNGKLQHYNRRAVELWGREPVCGVEQYCGSLRLWLPDGTLLPHDQSPMVSVLRTGILARGKEVMIERPDGSRLPILANLAPLKNEQGEVTGAIASFIDISERKHAEEALREQFELTRTITNNSTQAIFMMDTSGYTTFINPAAEKMFGFTFDEIRARPLHEMIHHHHPEGWPHPIGGRTIGHGPGEDFQVREYEDIFVRKNGEFFPVLVNASPIFDEQHHTVSTVIEVRDITKRSEAEEELRQSEARKEAILNSALDAIITIDHKGNFMEFNRAAEKIFGYSRAKVIGKPMVEFIIPERLRKKHLQGLAHYLSTGEGPVLSRQIELPALRADGTEFPAELAIVPIPGRQPPMFTGFLRDITERKRSEKVAREAAERFRFMAESMPQKIFTARPNGDVDYVNPQWVEFFGMPFEQIRDWRWVSLVHPDDVEETVRRWKHAIETGEYIQLEHRFRHKDGIYRWHLTRARAMRDAEGKITMWIGSNTDIDDQKRAEEKLEKAVAERTGKLKESVKSLESLSYTMAHDLRSPIRAMNTISTALMEDVPLDEKGRNYAERIHRAAERMDQLVNDLLEYSQLAHHEFPIHVVDLKARIEKVLAQLAKDIEAKNAKIQIAVPLPAVQANETLLEQILTNLLLNALKFVAPGVIPKVLLRAEILDSMVRLWVEDNGIGIAPQYQEKIFGVFQRLHTTEEFPGTGVGLAITKRAVERIGGSVGVESEVGKGSKFWIELSKSKAG